MTHPESLNVLIVEDEAILAVALASTVNALGHNVAGLAIDYGNAKKMCAECRIDVALVDLHLSDGPTGAAIARLLVKEHAACVIFLTGNPEDLPDDFCGAIGVVPKPYNTAWFAEVFAFTLELRRSAAAAPKQLRLAPWFHPLRGPGVEPLAPAA
jgi:DNA-binding LytR/AlgR family response regulator